MSDIHEDDNIGANKTYDKIIFVCKNNTFLSPIAEAIYKEKSEVWMPAPSSRGIVVLFEEPISPKVNLLLSGHKYHTSNHMQSRQLRLEDITEDTLVLTMTLSEKVRILDMLESDRRYEHIYTIGEFSGMDIDVQDPYGCSDDIYEECFLDLIKRVELVMDKLA